MKKIAFLLNSLSGGGTERVTLSLANGLVKRGCSVTLLVVSKTGELLSQVDPAVAIVDLGKQRVVECLLGVRRYLRSEQPSVLFTALPTVNIVGITAKIIANVRTAVVPVEHMPVSIDARDNESLEPRLAYWLYPLFYRFVAGVVTVSSEARADFLATYPSIAPAKVTTIHNPVVTEKLFELAREQPVLTWCHGTAAQSPLIIGAGRLVRQKNFELLIEAFAQVRKVRPCRLLIMGAGADRGKLEKLIEELNMSQDILLPGFVANPYACMARADLFVLSSICEALSTVVIEALACGLQVVATNCTGVTEILDGGTYGTVLDLETVTPKTLGDAMMAALDKPVSRTTLEQRGREFSDTVAIDAYLELIDRVTV